MHLTQQLKKKKRNEKSSHFNLRSRNTLFSLLWLVYVCRIDSKAPCHTLVFRFYIKILKC